MKPTPVKLIPSDLMKGGVDLVFYFDIPKAESLKRALGRRQEMATGELFHLQNSEPPVDRPTLNERLV